MPTPYRVTVAHAVEHDLGDIYDHIARETPPARAEKVFQRLREPMLSLAVMPQRASWPPELLALGIQEFRQLVVRPWRIFCLVSGDQVSVLLVADTRRNLQSLLQRRLLTHQVDPGA